LGMLLSAGAITGFGASSSGAVFAVAFTLNGVVQSTGWPGTVKAMTPWFAPEERGRVMGRWSTCYQLGGLVATALAAFLLYHFGWRTAFRVPAIWVAGVGLLIAW